MSSWQKIVLLWTNIHVIPYCGHWILSLLLINTTISVLLSYGEQQGTPKIEGRFNTSYSCWWSMCNHHECWNIWIVTSENKANVTFYRKFKEARVLKKNKEAWTPIITPVVKKIFNESTMGITRSNPCQLSFWQPSGKFNFTERPIIVFNLRQSISQIRKHWPPY